MHLVEARIVYYQMIHYEVVAHNFRYSAWVTAAGSAGKLIHQRYPHGCSRHTRPNVLRRSDYFAGFPDVVTQPDICTHQHGARYTTTTPPAVTSLAQQR